MVPVGFFRKSSSVRPKRLCTSVTASERSGPILAAVSMPSELIEWQMKQPFLTKNAPSPASICRSFSSSSSVIVLLRRFFPFESQVRSDHAAATVDGVAGATILLLHDLLRLVDEIGARGLAVVAVAEVAIDLHHRLAIFDQVKVAHSFAEQRLFPMLDAPVSSVYVGRVTLSAVAGRAAELIYRMRLQNLLRVRSERIGSVLQSLPLDPLMAGRATVNAAAFWLPDLLQASGDFLGARRPELFAHRFGKMR